MAAGSENVVPRSISMDAIHRRTLLARSGLAAVILSALVVAQAWGVNPKSPEVKRLIDKGFKYLDTAADGRLGGKCLVAMTYLKAGKPAEHPHVKEALELCQTRAKLEPAQNHEDVYSLGMAVMFLCELDSSKYATEIQHFLDVLKLRQKDHGGWGYADRPTGDTSMTQYGVLSAWTAQKAGFAIADESLEKVAGWLIRTQDPSGGWGYQGNDPGTYDKVAQSDVRISLTTAALGSSLIAADLLNVIDMADEGLDDELPPALIPVVEDEAAANVNKNVDAKRLRASVSMGTGWFRKNYSIKPGGFTHYYLYALERFMSFKEKADGQKPKEAPWYNDGYRYLKETQNEDGSWKSAGGDAVDTAFAILFLLRSTQKAIEKVETFGAGTLVGGRGLPRNTANVKLRGGRLVAENQAQAVEDMLKALGEADDEADLDLMVANPDEIELSTDQKERAKQLKQLRQVVRTGSPKARLAAVKSLGESQEIQYVPLLIYAITDPDPRVAVAADEALRTMSRKLDAKAPRAASDAASRTAAVAYWKDWFTRLYPDLALEGD
jgi:hypothetical protein